MKKLATLLLLSSIGFHTWAGNGTNGRPTPLSLQSGTINHTSSIKSKPKSQRAGSNLQKVKVGSSGNLLSVLNDGCHQIHADDSINTVMFIHRANPSSSCCGGPSSNVAQYRYDVSKDGGITWSSDIGPLNPLGNNTNISCRYPQAMIYRSSGVTSPDSSYLVYNGSWHNGGSSSIWQGQYHGSGQLSGDSTTFNEQGDVVDTAQVTIATSMTRIVGDKYFNLNSKYRGVSGTPGYTDGLILERGTWNNTTHKLNWTYEDKLFPLATKLDANGAFNGNAFGDPSVSFDPTGKYGWIVFAGDLVDDNSYALRPQYLQSSDYGATWSNPQEINLDYLPGMFISNINAAVTTIGKTILSNVKVMTDSAGNPHIFAVVVQTDTATNAYNSYYPTAEKALYDIYLDKTSPCGWVANYIARIHAFDAVYYDGAGNTQIQIVSDNRMQVARSENGKKIFVLWNDTDSTVVAANTNNNTLNLHPNLLGVGIDMTIRKTTDIKNFTAGDSIFGGAVPSLGLTSGSNLGSLFPVVSQNSREVSATRHNIPVVLTVPDLARGTEQPAQYYYAQSVNFDQSEYVNKFDNSSDNSYPTLIVLGADTVVIRANGVYKGDSSYAYTCTKPVIKVITTSNVNTAVNGVYTVTRTATDTSNGNATVKTQVVIVADPPKAKIYYSTIPNSPATFNFTDTSSGPPTTRTWSWGDNTLGSNAKYTKHQYRSKGNKMVILKACNAFGCSSDTVYINVQYLTGIATSELEKEVSVYPNPTNGLVTVEMSSTTAADARISIYNLDGQMIQSPNIVKSNAPRTTLDMTGMAAGIYYIKIETQKGTAVKEVTFNK